MKSIIYKFDPVIYPWPLLVTKKFSPSELTELFYVVNTDDELEDADKDTFVPNPSTIARTVRVCSKKTNLQYIIVLLVRPKVIGNGTIAHEAYHFGNMIAEPLGFLPEKSTEDEPCAYLIQWGANCIASVKEGKPEVMKGEVFNEE